MCTSLNDIHILTKTKSDFYSTHLVPGEKCPCGAWVAPAFHIQRSKVDEVMTSKLPANQTQSKGQVTSNGRVLSGSGDVSTCTGKTIADTHDSSSAISCAVNEKPNEGKDTILEEILHPRRDDIL